MMPHKQSLPIHDGRFILKSLDEITVLGIISFFTLLITLSVRLLHGNILQLIWLCNIALAGATLGLLLRSRLLLTAQFVGILVYHFAWHLDFFSYLMAGRMPFAATAYMFSGDLTLSEKGLSFFQHTFLLPSTAWALWRLGPSRFGWRFQSLQTFAAFLLTYLLSRPGDNINWIFGAGWPELSPANISPLPYYLIMVLAPPLLVYLPTNVFALWLFKRRRIARQDNSSKRRRIGLVSAYTIILIAISLLVGMTCDVRIVQPGSLAHLLSSEATLLERLPTGAHAPQINSVSYGCPAQEMSLPLRHLDIPLPRHLSSTDSHVIIVMKEILQSLPITSIPAAPEGLVIRGNRGRRGTIVCAVVASDQFYFQPWCDLNTALDRFEVHSRIGRPGLAEFFDSVSDIIRETAKNSFVEGYKRGGLYAVTIVAFEKNHKASARSPMYIFKRTGIYTPDDVSWLPKGHGFEPTLISPPTCDPQK